MFEDTYASEGRAGTPCTPSGAMLRAPDLRRIGPILFILFLLSFNSFAATNVVFNLGDFTTTSLTNRKVIVTPMQAGASGLTLISDDQRKFSTDSSGSFIVTNMQAGLYQMEIMSPPATTLRLLQVPEGDATVYASAIMVTATNQTYPPGSTAYSTAASDALFIAKPSTPALNDVLTWDGSAWIAAAATGGSGDTNSLAGTNFVNDAAAAATNSAKAYADATMVARGNNGTDFTSLPLTRSNLSSLTFETSLLSYATNKPAYQAQMGVCHPSSGATAVYFAASTTTGDWMSTPFFPGGIAGGGSPSSMSSNSSANYDLWVLGNPALQTASYAAAHGDAGTFTLWGGNPFTSISGGLFFGSTGTNGLRSGAVPISTNSDGVIIYKYDALAASIGNVPDGYPVNGGFYNIVALNPHQEAIIGGFFSGDGTWHNWMVTDGFTNGALVFPHINLGIPVARQYDDITLKIDEEHNYVITKQLQIGRTNFASGMGPLAVQASGADFTDNSARVYVKPFGAGSGAYVTLDATPSSGGKKYDLASTGISDGLGAGKLAIYDYAFARYIWTLDGSALTLPTNSLVAGGKIASTNANGGFYGLAAGLTNANGSGLASATNGILSNATFHDGVTIGDDSDLTINGGLVMPAYASKVPVFDNTGAMSTLTDATAFDVNNTSGSSGNFQAQINEKLNLSDTNAFANSLLRRADTNAFANSLLRRADTNQFATDMLAKRAIAVQGASTVTANPSSSSVYHIGSEWSAPLQSSAVNVKVYMPIAGTVVACSVAIRDNGTTGSGESVTYAVTNITAATASATWTGAINTSVNYCEGTGLSLAVNAGDYICLRMLTPAWTTAPTSVTGTCTFFIQ